MANFDLSGKTPTFDPEPLRVRSSGGFGAAAGITDLSGVFQANRQRAPRFDKFAATDIQNRAQERAAIMAAEAKVAGAGLQSMAQVKSAEIISEAQVEAADKAMAGAKSGAMMSGIGSIIGAGIGLLSDETTKNHIERIDDALSVLRELKPVRFHYREEYSAMPERRHHGFIAQDFRHVLPDATYYDSSVDKLCIDTGDLIGLLVRSVQQLETRVMCLEAEKALAGVKS